MKNLDKNTENITFPEKDQAIELNVHANIPDVEYVRAISARTGSKNIIFASRTSDDVLCVYLSSKQIVDDIISNNEPIRVRGNYVKILRLRSPVKKIIISNIHPFISHHVIMEALVSKGVKTVSPLTFMKADLHDELSHVMGFKRQAFIRPEDAVGFPQQIALEHEGAKHLIFLTIGPKLYYLWKQLGHVSLYSNDIITEIKNTVGTQKNLFEI